MYGPYHIIQLAPQFLVSDDLWIVSHDLQGENDM